MTAGWIGLVLLIFGFVAGYVSGKVIERQSNTVGVLEESENDEKEMYHLVVVVPWDEFKNKKVVSFKVRKQNTPLDGDN